MLPSLYQADQISIYDSSHRLWAPSNHLIANNSVANDSDEDDYFWVYFHADEYLEGDAVEDCLFVEDETLGDFFYRETRGGGGEHEALGDPELEVLEDDEALKEMKCEYLQDW